MYAGGAGGRAEPPRGSDDEGDDRPAIAWQVYVRRGWRFVCVCTYTTQAKAELASDRIEDMGEAPLIMEVVDPADLREIGEYDH